MSWTISSRPLAHEAAKYDTNAGKLIRGAGNVAGRGRADTTGKARAAKPPRGQMLTTGEDVPTGHSCRARLFIVEWVKSDVDIAKLTAAQETGQAGHYAAAMAGYAQWLARDYLARKAAFEAERNKRRDAMHALYPHGRTAATAAALLSAWDLFLRFAEESRAIDAQEAAALAARADAAIREVANLQSDHQTAADPVDNFRRLIASAVASGRAHLASETNGAPENAQAWVWQGDGLHKQPRGDRIGWVKDGQVYLEPTAAHAAAQAMGRATNEAFSLTAATLQKRLYERGFVLSTEEEKGKKPLTVKKVLGGARATSSALPVALIIPKRWGKWGISR